MAIWENLDSFKEKSSFKTWAIGIASRKVADFYRQAYKDKDFYNYEDMDCRKNGQESNPVNQIVDSIDVETSLNTLPAQDRELLFLIFKAGLKYREIEAITGIPQGTIKSRVYHLKEKLRPLLEGGV